LSDKDIETLLSKARTLEAEKRTALALLRTGIMISTVPLSIFTLLISVSQVYDIWGPLYQLVIIISIWLSILVLGVILIVKAFRQIRSCDRALKAIKKSIEEIEKER